MAAVPVSDVAFVMSSKSKASCYLLRGLLYGPGYASLLRTSALHTHSLYGLILQHLRNRVV